MTAKDHPWEEWDNQWIEEVERLKMNGDKSPRSVAQARKRYSDARARALNAWYEYEQAEAAWYEYEKAEAKAHAAYKAWQKAHLGDHLGEGKC